MDKSGAKLYDSKLTEHFERPKNPIFELFSTEKQNDDVLHLNWSIK